MTLLVGPSGEGKSSSIRLGRNLMEKAGVRLLPEKSSTEKMINILRTNGIIHTGTRISTQQQDAIATVIAPELSILLSRQTYSESITDFLIRSYDAEDKFEYGTMKGGTVTLVNHCITFLGGITPIALGRSIPEKTHVAGWSARVVHVYHDKLSKLAAGETQKPSNPLCDLDDTDVSKQEIQLSQDREKALFDDLLEIKKIRGAVVYSKTGKEWYRDWHTKWRKSPESEGEGWPTRRHDHLSRIAILLRISEHGDLTLDDAAQEAALVALENLEVERDKCFVYVGRTQLADEQDKIINIFKRSNGKVSTPALLKQVRFYFRDHREFEYAMATLLRAHIIKYEGQANGVEWWALRRNP